MTRFEIEQKFPMTDLEDCSLRIFDLFEVRGQSKVRQTDQYLFHPLRDFAATDEAFRIRTTENLGQTANVCVTYKGPRVKETTASDDFKTRHEIEVPVKSERETESKLLELFSALGFRPAMVVKKERERLQAHFQGWDVEFALDQVHGLGGFLEVEVIARREGISEGQQILALVIERLGLSGSITDSYLEMLQTE